VFVIEKGILQRYVFADTFKIDTWAGIAFDCSDNLDQWSEWKGDSVTWKGTIFEASYSISDTDIPVDVLWAEPFNYPAGYEPVDFGNFTLRDGKFVDVTFTFQKIKPTTTAAPNQTPAPTTTATPRPPPPSVTQPSFTCPKNCDGKGVCKAQNMCTCIANYVNDPMLGCRRNDETTDVTRTAGPTITIVQKTIIETGTTATKVTDRVQVTMTTKPPGVTAPTRPGVVTLDPAKRTTAAPMGTLAPTVTTTTKSNAVTVAFEIVVALVALLALLI